MSVTNLSNQSQFYSGTSGLVLPVPNKSLYPPAFQDKSRLCYYASLFDSIEINSSFYKIPQPATVRKWTESVPDSFRFTYKLWRGITHQKDLVFDMRDINQFMKAINEAGDKKGSLLVQFPPSIKAQAIVQMQRLLTTVRESDEQQEWQVAVEFRDKSWYNDNTYRLLQHLDMSMVIHDLPASAAPMEVLDADFVYVRFHGPNGGYRGSYADNFLNEYASYINEWIEDGKTVYAYFNNTMGEAVKNLLTLNNFIQKKESDF